jgi:small subunit ribosomal protein S1
MASPIDRPVTIRQKNRKRKDAPELPAGGPAEGAPTPPPAQAEPTQQARAQRKPKPQRRELLKTEDLQALADMDRGDFAAMMAGTVPLKRLELGDRVSGPVVRMDERVVFVDLGGKAEGAMDRAELTDVDGRLTVDIGHTLTAFVVDTHGGGVQLSSQIRGEDAGAFLAEAKEKGIPIDGKVSEKNSGGFVVLLAGRRAFCPISQMALPGRPVDAEALVGRTLPFLVQELRGQDVVVTRRPLLEADAAEAAKRLWSSMAPGTDLSGVVTSIRDYGVFVDVGGIEGLVHISELAWTHTNDAKDVVAEGQEVGVRVLKVDPAAGRLSLSLRARNDKPVDPDAPAATPDKTLGTFGDLFAGIALKK